MIYEKLQKARVALQNKKLKKSGKNNYAGFTYYELSDFLPSVNEIFDELKLCSNFSLKENEATLTVYDWEDNTSETFTTPAESLELKGCTRIQALGGVHTYLKRYLYLNALEIVEADMLDPQTGKPEPPAPTPQKKPTKPAEKPNPDKAIIEGLELMQTSAEAQAYFKDNENNVKDLETFKKAYAKRWIALKASEKKVDNE